MKYIAHRGNFCGPSSEENKPEYIDTALDHGFDSEIDIHVVDSKIYLGHDSPQYEIDVTWLSARQKKLWIHCKNTASMEMCWYNGWFHYFWHESDKMVLTSKNIIWAHPGSQPIKNSIVVMPELYNEQLPDPCFGICSDYIDRYKKEIESKKLEGLKFKK